MPTWTCNDEYPGKELSLNEKGSIYIILLLSKHL